MPTGRVPEINRFPFTKSLFMYLRGEEVSQMQDYLSQLNDEYYFTTKKLPITGYFGFETVHFIRDFQNFCGISPTGAYDFQTHLAFEWKWLEMLNNFKNRQQAATQPLPAGMNNRKWW